MFKKLEVYNNRGGNPRESATYTKLGELYINVNHIVEIRDLADGFSAIIFHGGNSYVYKEYYVKMKADTLVTHLSTKK